METRTMNDTRIYIFRKRTNSTEDSTIDHCIIAANAKDAIRTIVEGYTLRGSRVSEDILKKESNYNHLLTTVRGFDGEIPINQNARRCLLMLAEGQENEYQIDCFGQFDNRIKTEELSHEEIRDMLNNLFIMYRG